MLRSPHLAAVVSWAASFAIRTGLGLTADGSLYKARPTGYRFKCKHSNRTKGKGTFSRKLQLITMCHHDVSAPLCLFKVLFETNLSFALLLCNLCSAAKFCYFSDRLNFYSNLGWAPNRGSKWHHFATTLVKGWGLLFSSVEHQTHPDKFTAIHQK